MKKVYHIHERRLWEYEGYHLYLICWQQDTLSLLGSRIVFSSHVSEMYAQGRGQYALVKRFHRAYTFAATLIVCVPPLP